MSALSPSRRIARAAAVLALGLAPAPDVAAQTSGVRTYANPIDIGYKYNFEQINQGISYRSGADPVIINHRGEYFLFLTIAHGWWHSSDLVNWRHVTPERWPFEDVVAPAALSVRDTVYLLPSITMQRPLLFSTRPETGELNFYNRWLPPLPTAMNEGAPGPYPEGRTPPGPWDPAFFHDPDTDRWYLYWGSSNVYPLYGIELDKERRLVYRGTPKPFIWLHPERHGWERFGYEHRDSIRPFIEGAWMTKHAGRYYLQYAAPGTEYNVYANGTYVGDDPLGPFTYAPYNPISYRPGGFMTGAGHGNTFQDRFGNFWNTGTPWIGVNWNFERRISMFPAGFDRDGQMFVNTRFGDFPHYAPTGRWTDKDALFTGWMLLSYRKPAVASSARDTLDARHVVDENPRTFWVAGSNRAGETLTLDLQRPSEVRALQVNYADYQSGLFASDSTVYTQFRVYHSLDGERWEKIADLTGERRDRPNAYIELPAPVQARFLRYEHVYVGSPNLAISDFRVFGNQPGRPPRTPRRLTARRDADARNAFIRWEPVEGVVGYNVLWGIRPDKLYQTYQLFADRGAQLELRALTVGQEYYVAIEAFDERGVSRPSAVVHLP